ncbi:Cytochrome P450 [Mycena sanguinolenta]|uniref:Cytochrome P450 n=1 Tax=Mycena sanguinolenta TaxID=230812 RepID=A0A8H7CLX7_9AGAR|nr:Cytochrome P450 [Mycena sanguinolenta]
MDSGIALVGVFSLAVAYVTLRQRSSIQNIPGPPSPSWIFGNMLQLILPGEYGANEFAWLKAFGAVYRLKGCFGTACSFRIILRYSIFSIALSSHMDPLKKTGIDLIFAEKCVMAQQGDTHKRLRAALNPCFTGAAVRNFLPIFEKVAQAMTAKFEESSGSEVDVCPVFSEATLSTISEAALGYPMQDLNKDFVAYNERLLALAVNLSPGQILSDAISVRLPRWILKAAIHLPLTTFHIIRTAKALAKELGGKIIREKIDVARQGSVAETDVFDMLLDLGNPEKKKNALTLDEIVDQTGILLVGGQDTTSNTLAFGLLELARHPTFQDELRVEIHSAIGAASGTPVYDNMPLLNAFIKETLRVYPVGAFEERIATQDTVIPLAYEIQTTTGKIINQIPVSKGQVLHVAIASYQRLESHWGEDAHKFRPSRWLDGTVYQGQAIGPYANLLTFFGGPRACLGYANPEALQCYS